MVIALELLSLGLSYGMLETYCLRRGVGSVQIEPVVPPPRMCVAQYLDDRAGAFSTREIDDIAVAGGFPENIVLDDDVSIGGMPVP